MRYAMTKRQNELYEYLCAFTEENGFQPSYREMAVHMGCTGLNTIAGHIKAIERKGYIKLGGASKSRAIAFVGGPPWRAKGDVS